MNDMELAIADCVIDAIVGMEDWNRTFEEDMRYRAADAALDKLLLEWVPDKRGRELIYDGVLSLLNISDELALVFGLGIVPALTKAAAAPGEISEYIKRTRG